LHELAAANGLRRLVVNGLAADNPYWADFMPL
jgi:hypothetical protein